MALSRTPVGTGDAWLQPLFGLGPDAVTGCDFNATFTWQHVSGADRAFVLSAEYKAPHPTVPDGDAPQGYQTSQNRFVQATCDGVLVL